MLKSFHHRAAWPKENILRYQYHREFEYEGEALAICGLLKFYLKEILIPGVMISLLVCLGSCTMQCCSLHCKVLC